MIMANKKNKKHTVLTVLCLGVVSLLSGCGDKYPAKAADGQQWNKEWTILGSTLGIEEADNGFTLSENPVVLSGSDTHYATWTYGEASSYTNAEGKETDLYPSEIYVLVSGAADATTAESTVAEWIEKEKEVYDEEDFSEIECNGQPYTLMTYTISNPENPYCKGVSAFGTYGSYCITAEICCTEAFEGDEKEILLSFLNNCHYNAAQSGN